MNGEHVVYVDADLENLIPDFLDNRRKDIELIKQLLGAKDYDEIKRIGHSMKGAGGGYGFDEISRIGKEIEEAAKSGNPEEITKWVNYLNDYLNKVKIVLQEI